jgi:polar amino acid transport system substrate-binding protein
MTLTRRAILLVGAALGVAAAAPADALHELAPTGTLRAAINFGNPVLAQRAPGTGAPGGVSVALAQALGRQLGVPVTLVPFEEAGQVSKAASAGVWDICFLAIDPVRGTEIAFTAPYALIEGCYAVPNAAPLRTAEEVDRDGIKVAVAAGSAYDLYLTRALKHAQLVRLPNTNEAVAAFEHDPLDVLAGVKQPLLALIARHPGLRLLDGRFMSIDQAMGMLQGRPAGLAYLQAFLAQAKTSGLVAEALRASGHGDVPVPAA